jgi:hypothetical protein
MPDNLQVRVTLSESPVIDPLTGAISKQVIVRYLIGQHGPFQDVYEKADYTVEKARAAIDERVRGLRTLTSGL